MATRIVQVALNAIDPSGLAEFWAKALGWEVIVYPDDPDVPSVEPSGFSYPDPAAVVIDFVPVPEPKTVKNRVHLDLVADSAGVRRLRELGAVPIDIGQGDVPWTVLADPEGNEFCACEPHPLYKDTGSIGAITVDCTDPAAMAEFWSKATDWRVVNVGDSRASLRSPAGVGPYLRFARTPDVKTVQNRMHIDVRPYPDDDHKAEADRIRELGARDADVGQGDVPWVVLADPEGNEFCVLTPM